MENNSQFWSVFLGVLFGGLKTLMVSFLYYRKSSKDLMESTNNINKMISFVVHFLEENDNKQCKVKWDDKGNPIGLDITLIISDSNIATDAMNATITVDTNK
jgi:hypothetical protein